MGRINKPLPVKLIVGLIYKEESILLKTQTHLIRRFGKIDFTSPAIDFNYTNYYKKEMGTGLKRKFLSFAKLINPESLAKIKIATNAIESKLAKKNLRTINIDPGYLDLAKLVLATTKDFAHRIYLNNGIYAEITLSYKGNTFKESEWTYPDYRTPEYVQIFNNIRTIYKNQL